MKKHANRLAANKATQEAKQEDRARAELGGDLDSEDEESPEDGPDNVSEEMEREDEVHLSQARPSKKRRIERTPVSLVGCILVWGKEFPNNYCCTVYWNTDKKRKHPKSTQ